MSEAALEAYLLYSRRESAALLILAVWGVVNLVAGVFLSRWTSGQSRHFWQVAALWGAVNTVIGLPQYLDIAGPAVPPATLSEAIRDGVGTARLLAGAFVADLTTMLVGGRLPGGWSRATPSGCRAGVRAWSRRACGWRSSTAFFCRSTAATSETCSASWGKHRGRGYREARRPLPDPDSPDTFATKATTRGIGECTTLGQGTGRVARWASRCSPSWLIPPSSSACSRPCSGIWPAPRALALDAPGSHRRLDDGGAEGVVRLDKEAGKTNTIKGLRRWASSFRLWT